MTKDDIELTSLLTKLYTLQEDVGAKPKTSDEDKQQKATSVSVVSMGKGRAAKKAGSRFLELKSSIIDRLQTAHRLLQEEAERTSGRTPVARGNNPKEIIAAQAELREQIRTMGVEWGEMNNLYKSEVKKRRSKFTQSELEVQATLVQRLQAEIDKCKEAQMKGYGRGGATEVASVLNTRALAELDSSPLFDNTDSATGGGWGGGLSSGLGAPATAPGVPLNDGQRMQIQQLQERDQDFDNQLDVIGDGIQDLAEIAEMQGEEARRQNALLDNLGSRVDGVHNHVTNVNDKMKETLDEMGRSTDKICVDIMCILMAVGFVAVIYNVFKFAS